MIITKTPLRVSLFGGGTDYPVWYREHGGAVLSTSIDKYCCLTCRWMPPFFDYRSKVSYSQVEHVGRNAAIQHPAVRACLQLLHIEDGIEIHHVADLPARSGLGTSSAFTVGLLLGLHALRNESRDKYSLAMEAIHVEQDLLTEAVGAQDQFIAAYGGFNRINFHTDGSVEVKRIEGIEGRLKELETHLDMYFTGFSRTASDIAREQIRLTPGRNSELRALMHLVNEAETVLESRGTPITEIGVLLNEAWKVKRSLTKKITNAEIDEIYQAGISAGAIGGKLLGAGGGGFFLFLVRPEERSRLRTCLKKLLSVPFAFSQRGAHVVLNDDERLIKSGTHYRSDSGVQGEAVEHAIRQ